MKSTLRIAMNLIQDTVGYLARQAAKSAAGVVIG